MAVACSALASYVHDHATPEQREDFEERAAIGEYERGMSRDESEREAARLVGVEWREQQAWFGVQEQPRKAKGRRR